MNMLEKNVYAMSVPTIVDALRTFGAVPAGSRTYSVLDIHDLLIKGIPWGFVFKIKRKTGLHDNDLAAFLGVSTSTLQRAHQDRKRRMSRNISEHAVRLAVVILAAFALLDGDAQSAVEWLQSPAFRLTGRVPFEASATEIGAKEVLNIMGRIDRGIPP